VREYRIWASSEVLEKEVVCLVIVSFFLFYVD
jgi:hypothetical protein